MIILRNIPRFEFVELLDTPTTYSGFAEQFAIVKTDETGLEFLTLPIDDYILKDGSRPFIATISGVDPTDPEHLTTKQYVDDLVTTISGLLDEHSELGGLDQDDHFQYILVDGTRGFTSTVSGIDPVDPQHLATKFYVDAEIATATSGTIWLGQTTNSGITEIFVQGINNNRYVIDANTVETYHLIVAGVDLINDDAAMYVFEGAIRRDSTNNTDMVGDFVKTIVSEDDISWNATIEADNFNDALIVKVQGDTTNTVNWQGTLAMNNSTTEGLFQTTVSGGTEIDYNTWETTASGSQTVFDLPWAYEDIAVYVNGARQFPSAYTETDADTITFSAALNASDAVFFVAPLDDAGVDFNTWQTTASGSQTVFDLPWTYEHIAAYVNGTRQFPSAYTETDNDTITFSTGLTNGDEVYFVSPY